MKAWRSLEHIFHFPKATYIQIPPSAGQAAVMGPLPSAPLPPFLAILRNTLGLVPRADEYSRPGPNWEQLAVVSTNVHLFAVAPRAERCLMVATSIPVRSRDRGQGSSG